MVLKQDLLGLPASLVEELTQQRTAALQARLATDPGIALAAVVHSLTLRGFYPYGATSCLDLRMDLPGLGAVSESPAALALQAERERWGEHLPGEASDLWAWCLAQDREQLLALLAVVTAQSVNAVRHKGESVGDRLRHADQLATALTLDMTKWYAPTAISFFSRIPKSLTLAAIEDARQAPNATAWTKLKKVELAALAERAVAGTGWLPEPLRSLTDDEGTDVPVAA